jgi:mono/diheme cytochrome c family protein
MRRRFHTVRLDSMKTGGSSNRFRLLACGLALSAATLVGQPPDPPSPATPRRAAPDAPALPLLSPDGIKPSTGLRAVQPAQPGSALAWEVETKEYTALPDEWALPFRIGVTNLAREPVTIYQMRTSCGCTVARLPTLPFTLAPGTNAQLQATMDVRGKFGTVVKTITVESSAGTKLLSLKANLPLPASATLAEMNNRSRNQQLAAADRQAVFRGDCAKCHLEPAVGQTGETLYLAACGICHDAEHRASMVPDLLALKTVPTGDYWKQWIETGKTNSLMPAFAKSQGGPLTDAQIESLVGYLLHRTAPPPVAAPRDHPPDREGPPAPTSEDSRAR